ncbi:hypothetical protein [Streptomyces kaniharaensis]|nr:hypothetical protein [Streptomyces kaniharaensis]
MEAPEVVDAASAAVANVRVRSAAWSSGTCSLFGGKKSTEPIVP